MPSSKSWMKSILPPSALTGVPFSSNFPNPSWRECSRGHDGLREIDSRMRMELTDSVPNRVAPRVASLGSAELTVKARAIGQYREGFGTPLAPRDSRSDPARSSLVVLGARALQPWAMGLCLEGPTQSCPKGTYSSGKGLHRRERSRAHGFQPRTPRPCGCGRWGPDPKKGRRPILELRLMLPCRISLTGPQGNSLSAPAEGRVPEPVCSTKPPCSVHVSLRERLQPARRRSLGSEPTFPASRD